MIDSKGIYRKANELVQLYASRDALAIAEHIGIDIVYVDYFKHLLGMYAYRWKHRVIFLNEHLDAYMIQMVAGHEIGHDIFHRKLAKGDGLKEFELFRMRNAAEYEANAMAAHILIDTDECLEYARSGYDVIQLAKIMNSEINLMLIKLQELNKLGYNLHVPMNPRSDFLKNIKA